jgi:hypothetical protein
MRASEFIAEAKETPIPGHAENQMQTAIRARDVGGYDRTYWLNRFGMAVAKADGKSRKAVDSPSSSWNEKYNTLHPYSKEEVNMVHQALATVPNEGKKMISNHASEEKPDTHKVSPVKAFKGYR